MNSMMPFSRAFGLVLLAVFLVVSVLQYLSRNYMMLSIGIATSVFGLVLALFAHERIKLRRARKTEVVVERSQISTVVEERRVSEREAEAQMRVDLLTIDLMTLERRKPADDPEVRELEAELKAATAELQAASEEPMDAGAKPESFEESGDKPRILSSLVYGLLALIVFLVVVKVTFRL